MNKVESQKFEQAVTSFTQDRLDRANKSIAAQDFSAASIFLQDAADVAVLVDVNKNSQNLLQITSFIKGCQDLEEVLRDDLLLYLVEQGFQNYIE